MTTLTHKTYTPKQAEISKKWFLIDAKDKPVGKISTEIANILRGKNKPTFTNHLDTGDYVVVINAAEVKLTGNKEMQKKYYSHSGFPGGFKEITAQKLREKNPTQILKFAVEGMLPKNKLRKKYMQKLKLFSGAEHTHEAQKPEIIEI
ncbi:50S ribosomal protein L13 [Candidatus Peregrinibacteria bacterium]|nr:50S ribosomal protein L13 [Candidatus Peregrinibacteria bacterium]